MKQFILFVLCVLTAVSLSAQNKFPFYDRGYAGSIELGCLVKPYPYGTLSTTHGYCFGKGWFIGLGGMFESGFYGRNMKAVGTKEDFPYEGDMMLKLFLDLRKTFALSSVNLFTDVKLGTVRNLALDISWWDAFVRPSAGIVFGRHWAVSAGVDWTRGQYRVYTNDCEPYRFKESVLPYIGIAFQF